MQEEIQAQMMYQTGCFPMLLDPQHCMTLMLCMERGRGRSIHLIIDYNEEEDCSATIHFDAFITLVRLFQGIVFSGSCTLGEKGQVRT